jgi:hypothetical protein
MALINHDSYSTPSGVTATDTFIVEDADVRVRKGATDYETRGTAHVYLSQTDFNDGKRPIDRLPIKVLSSVLTPLGSVYDVILTHLKGQFPNHTEV